MHTCARLQDLASGYMSGKLLMKLDSIGFLLAHHTADHFSFLDNPANSRNRWVSGLEECDAARRHKRVYVWMNVWMGGWA